MPRVITVVEVGTSEHVEGVPNARMSIIPQPPPRRAPSEPRQQTRLGPEPIIRRS